VYGSRKLHITAVCISRAGCECVCVTNGWMA